MKTNNKYLLCYASEISKSGDIYFVEYMGDMAWDSFGDILYDFEENDIDPSNVIILYYGCFGEDLNDEWLNSVIETSKKVKEIRIMDVDDLVESEMNVIKNVMQKCQNIVIPKS